MFQAVNLWPGKVKNLSPGQFLKMSVGERRNVESVTIIPASVRHGRRSYFQVILKNSLHSSFDLQGIDYE